METSRSFRERTRAGFRIFRNRRFIEAGAIALAAFLPALAAGIATGMLLRYRVLGAWLVPLLAVAGIALAAVLGVRFGRAHRLSHPEFLRHLERRLDLRENQLVNADEMAERSARMEDPLARGLAELAVQAGDEALRNVSFPRLAPALDLRRPALWGGGGVAVLAILFAVSPGAFTGSAGRLVRPGRAELPPALAIRVEPGNTTVERGAAVTVTARLPKPGSGVQLYMRSPGGPWKTLAMDPSGALRFAALIPEVVETTEYAVASGRARSETYRIRVIEPLRASGYRKRVEFPAYTGLAAVEELSADGNLNALVGSRASLTVLPTRPGATGRLLVTGGSPIPLETGGKDELIAVLPVRGPLDYRVELSAKDLPGSHWESEPFRLDAAADRPPSLFQLSPERASKIPPDMQVQLDVECLDDFGLSRLDLVYRRNDGEPKRIQLSRWGGGKEARVLYPWALDGVAAVPGDRIGYHLELTDNDAVTGPKTTVGPECELRFPSLDEMYTEVQEDRSGQMQSAQEALEQQKDLQRNLDRIQSDLKQSKTMRWEQQQQLQDLAAKQQKIAEQIGDLSKSLDSSLDRMQQGSLVTPEMLQKVQQINDMVRDLQSPELRDYLQKLQDALQRLDRNAVNQALEKLQLTQQELERNLDRTLEMLKQLQREENLDRLVKQAENLVEQQKELNRQLQECKPGDKPKLDQTGDQQGTQDPSGKTPEEMKSGEKSGDQKAQDKAQEQKSQDQKNGQNGDQKKDDQQGGDKKDAQDQQDQKLTPEQAEALKQKQEALRAELEKLQKQLAELQAEAEKHWQELKKQMQERSAEQQLSDASKDMQNASESMQGAKKSESLKFGRQAEKNLQSFAAGMKAASAQMRGADQEEVTRELYRLSGRLVRLSQEQEDLLSEAPSRTTRDLAVDQMRLSDGAKKTLDDLYNLARKSEFITPELGRIMGNAVRQLQDSQQGFAEGNRGTGMASGTESIGALDETVLALLNANQQMCSSSCSGGSSNPFARMQSLSGQQEALNSQMQQMFGSSGGGERLSSEGGNGEKLLQMAAQQEMIQRGLQELQQSIGQRSDMLGRLGDLGKDMEEVVQEMRSRNVDRRILERQERILSRLLTAQHSLRKEGQKEERVSRTGVNPADRESPPAVPDLPSWLDALRRGILRGSQDPVPGEYRKIVERYFRSLGEQAK